MMVVNSVLHLRIDLHLHHHYSPVVLLKKWVVIAVLVVLMGVWIVIAVMVELMGVFVVMVVNSVFHLRIDDLHLHHHHYSPVVLLKWVVIAVLVVLMVVVELMGVLVVMAVLVLLWMTYYVFGFLLLFPYFLKKPS
jgi:hypothetical protein